MKSKNMKLIIAGAVALLVGVIAYFIFGKSSTKATTATTGSKAADEDPEKEQTEQNDTTQPDGTYTNPLADPNYSPGAATTGGSGSDGSTTNESIGYVPPDSTQGNQFY